MIPNSLKDKLKRFNPNRPYVWELKITEDEFFSLEADLYGYTPDASKKDDALKILVYLAEWYKRRYSSRAKKAYQETFGDIKPDLKTVWGTLGIDKRFLYEGEGRQKLYLYSTFVFGGLSVHFELQKNDNLFLKSLCRVLNGEDDSFEIFVDASHSIAFRESVKQKHCLFVYLKTIVEHYNNPEKLPFALEDYKLAGTKIKELVDLIKSINDAVKKSKFRLEWLFVKSDDVLVRSIRFWLNPEEKGRLHQILRCDRLNRWGISNPEELHYVYIGLRFKLGDKVVEDTCRDKAVFSYRNTGNPEVGFIAEVEHFKHITNVPVTEFDKVEIVTWDKDGSELVVQEEERDFSAIQLFREEDGEERWTSRTRNQKDTVVMYSDAWALGESSVDKSAERLTLYNKRYSDGMLMNWCEIHTSVTIEKG